jgi:hypothetical protein
MGETVCLSWGNFAYLVLVGVLVVCIVLVVEKYLYLPVFIGLMVIILCCCGCMYFRQVDEKRNSPRPNNPNYNTSGNAVQGRDEEAGLLRNNKL